MCPVQDRREKLIQLDGFAASLYFRSPPEGGPVAEAARSVIQVR